MRRLLALVIACSACSGLDSLHGVCGDGVVDRGEDCDSETNCRACSIDCSSVACPGGYACGVDKLCHAPGGAFASAAPSGARPLPVFGFGVTDTNGDGYSDVVGLSRSSLDVLYGDAAGQLASSSTMIIPAIEGPPSINHIDNDKSLDLVIPTADGLVGYVAPNGFISPFPFPNELAAKMGMPTPILPISLDGPNIALLADMTDHKVGVVFIDGSIKDPEQAIVGFESDACPGIVASTVDRTSIDHYDLAAAVPSHVIALATTTGALCTFEVRANAVVAKHEPGSVALGTAPVLARLGAGACPSLIVTSPAGQAQELQGIGVIGACTTSTARDLPMPFGTRPSGRLALKPPIAGQGDDALVYRVGIYAIASATAQGTLLFSTARGISEAVTADLDGDGDLDGVLANNDPLNPIDDLELVYRYGTTLPGLGSPDPAGFLSVGLDTIAAPHHLVAGDFDGDGIGDFTYTEAVIDRERLMIAFGTRDQVRTPAFVSAYDHVLTSAPIRLANTVDPSGTKVDDLFVVDIPSTPGSPTTALLLTVLYGSPQRTLIPYFDPRIPDSSGTSFGFSGAATGHFVADGTPNFLDLLGIELFIGTSATVSAKLWLFKATALGGMLKDTVVTSSAIGPCRMAMGPKPLLCTDQAAYRPWSPAGTGHEVIFAFDQSEDSNMIVLDPTALAAIPPHVALAGSIIDLGLAPSTSYVADIDGDGVNEIIAGYRPARAAALAPSGAVVACTYDGAIHCATIAVPELAGWSCFDAAPAHIYEQQRFDPVPPAAPQELAMACRTADRTELFRITHDTQGFHATALLRLPQTTDSIQIADVTGDGVDDVLVFDNAPNSAVPLLEVHPQCTSRDVAVCKPEELTLP